MKKTLCIAAFVLVTIGTQADGVVNNGSQYFMADGYLYQLNTDSLTAELTGFDVPYEGDSLFIPESVTRNDSIFSVTSIGKVAYYEENYPCIHHLRYLYIPPTITYISDSAFVRCDSLLTVEIHSNALTGHDYDILFGGADIPLSRLFGEQVTTFILGEEITTIGQLAFMGSYCTTVHLPNTLQTINHAAFHYCCNLDSICIPGSVNTIGNRAFEGCSSLSRVTFQEGVQRIGAWAFAGCEQLTEVHIPASVNSIGYILVGENDNEISGMNSPFAGCTNLQTITVDTANKVFDSRDSCNTIIRKQIHTQITLISGCKNSIIPEDVTIIGKDAFYGMSAMQSITCEAIAPPACPGGSATFYNVSRSIPLYVPAESLAAYQAAPVWQEFLCIQPISQTETILDSNEAEGTDIGGIYDLYGRRYLMSQWEELPRGVYILSEDGKTAKVRK